MGGGWHSFVFKLQRKRAADDDYLLLRRPFWENLLKRYTGNKIIFHNSINIHHSNNALHTHTRITVYK